LKTVTYWYNKENILGKEEDMKKILIVEDEEKLSRLLELELNYENYETEIASNGQDALLLLLNNDYDLVLLDIMIPELSGLEVLRRLRRQHITTPVILLTARDEVHDKVSGLDLGANDYVTKPFQIEELLARIRAHLRMETKEESTDTLSMADLTVDTQTRQIYRDRQAITLTSREFDLLVYLMKHKKQGLTRDQLIEEVWGYDYMGDTNVVDVYIRYIRQKLDHGYENHLIHTVRGVGYMMKDPTL